MRTKIGNKTKLNKILKGKKLPLPLNHHQSRHTNSYAATWHVGWHGGQWILAIVICLMHLLFGKGMMMCRRVRSTRQHFILIY